MVLRGLRSSAALLLRNERLLAISVATVLVMAGQGVIAPVLPLYAESFGVGAATIGLTLSFFAIARLVLNVPLGVLSDRRGRRVLLVGGPLVTAVGMIGSGLASSIVVLLAWRLVAGAGSAMYMTGAQVYLADISTPANRAKLIGTNQGALLLGTAIGPAIGGYLADAAGLEAPFYVVGAAALVACAYSWFRLPETRPEPVEEPAAPDGAPPGRRPWVALVLSKDFLSVALVTMAIFFTRTGSRMTLMPLLAVGLLDFSVASLGLVFTAMAVINMVGLAPAAWMADTLGRKHAIVPSGLAVGAALVLLSTGDSQLTFLLGALALAVATSIAGPAPAAYAADVAPPHLRGLGMAMYRTAGDIGFVIGPPLLGAIADATTIRVALVANAGLVVVATAVFALVASETLEREALEPETPPATEPVEPPGEATLGEVESRPQPPA
ncbi:MAG TPA: MFS transporter [Acidimicrobiales bacterium]|nr:MFS transporter [Acidimicrobiales bacterium]